MIGLGLESEKVMPPHPLGGGLMGPIARTSFTRDSRYASAVICGYLLSDPRVSQGGTPMDQEDVRKEAVRRFLAGERSRRICSEFRRSKRWLLKWAQRSKTGGPDGFKGRDKKPERCPHQTDLGLEQQVIEARKKLEVSKYSRVGPLAVAWELHEAGVKAPPPRTISRILRRHGLVRHRDRYVPKGKDYPEIPALTPHEVHPMDIVGPRFISGDGRFYSINVMDVFTGKAALNPSRQLGCGRSEGAGGHVATPGDPEIPADGQPAPLEGQQPIPPLLRPGDPAVPAPGD